MRIDLKNPLSAPHQAATPPPAAVRPRHATAQPASASAFLAYPDRPTRVDRTQDLPIQEQQRRQGLLMRRGRHLQLDGKIAKERPDLLSPHFARMSSTVKGDKTADPLDIRLLSPYAVVLVANHFPKAPKQSRGLAHFHDVSINTKLLCINTVFHIYPFGKRLRRRHARQRRQREPGMYGAFAIYPC